MVCSLIARLFFILYYSYVQKSRHKALIARIFTYSNFFHRYRAHRQHRQPINRSKPRRYLKPEQPLIMPQAITDDNTDPPLAATPASAAAATNSQSQLPASSHLPSSTGLRLPNINPPAIPTFAATDAHQSPPAANAEDVQFDPHQPDGPFPEIGEDHLEKTAAAMEG